MTDMLVKLYNIPDDWGFLGAQAERGVTIRKPIGPEKHAIIRWVGQQFSPGWASETDTALSNQPTTCFIAERDETLLGFACYDAAALGIFGPTGVEESERGRGIGKALLLACMLDMKLQGYGYAVIGWVGPAAFYEKVVGAVAIPDSRPGFYKGMLPD